MCEVIAFGQEEVRLNALRELEGLASAAALDVRAAVAVAEACGDALGGLLTHAQSEVSRANAWAHIRRPRLSSARNSPRPLLRRC